MHYALISNVSLIWICLRLKQIIKEIKVFCVDQILQGLLEPEVYGGLVHKLKQIVIWTDFPDQLRK